MVVMIYDFETKKLLNKVQIEDCDNISNIEHQLSQKQEKEDILNLGYTCRISSIGITEYYVRGLIIDSMSKKGSIEKHTSSNSFVYGYLKDSDTCKEPSFVKIRTNENEIKETTLKIGIYAYKTGYVISTGKKGSNLFGGTYDAYLKSIGSRNFHGAGIKDAKRFKDFASMFKYVEKNQTKMEYLVSHYGYQFELKYSCEYFEKDIENTLSSKETIAKEKLEILFSAINSYEEIKKENESNNQTINKEDLTPTIMKEEALKRMKELSIIESIVQKFRQSDIVFLSEFGGIIYELDDVAKKLIEHVKEKGYLPYHIVKTNMSIGTLYSCLYVSNNPEEWVLEHRDKEDRIATICYNSDCDFYDYGDSCFISTNGGLQRTA